jgi:hypothetical protein
MKKLLFLLLCLSTQAYGIKSLSGLFCSNSVVSEHEEIQKAILNSEVNKVLELVKPNVDRYNLEEYIELAGSNFGKTPAARFKDRFIGSVKIALGMALLYKTGDYFKTEYLKTKEDFINRYKSMHNILMDIACLSGFISSSNFITDGVDTINPRSNYKKQLLINLYLKSLKKD